MRIKLKVGQVERWINNINYEYFWTIDPIRLKIRAQCDSNREEERIFYRHEHWNKNNWTDQKKINDPMFRDYNCWFENGDFYLKDYSFDLYDTCIRPTWEIDLRATKYIIGGLFNIEFDANYDDSDDFFLDWLIRGRFEHGYFEIFPSNDEMSFKIEFWDCFCSDYSEHMTIGNKAHKIKLRISPAITRHNKTVVHEKRWKMTNINEKSQIATYPSESKDAQYYKIHFEDTMGNMISNYMIDDEVVVVIKTENAIGKTITVQLDEKEVDFEHNGERLPNDELTIKIAGDIHKENIKIIEPAKK